ncbi:MAG TPA: M28 family metallopeptidase [Candidatus Polarisedimenticolia bacterium]|jgi:N-acetylated-alpha-linked acidic dipeptidase|nr:M28 family metallopeptidase [Candidatus Polarisedimenticolia bacterium]
MNGRVLLTAAAAPALAALLLAAPRPPDRRASGPPGAPKSAAGSPAAPGSPVPPATGIFGFLRASLPRQREIEALLLSLPDTARVEEHARVLTGEPHIAGTPGNARVQRYIADRFKEAGLDVEMKSYDVYMGYVNRALLEQVAPEPRLLTRPEEGVPEDRDASDPRASLNWNAYSPSCDLTREVVYVNHARPEDFAALDRLGVSVKDRLVLARYYRGYRGGKAQEAQKRGAAGIIFYSDPMEDGYYRGDVYPHGPWGPESHFQRGATAFDYIVPGDPLTPGWASLPGARRIDPRQAENLPRIPSVPISWRDALVVFRNLAGPAVPRGWQGGLPLTYHVGPGPARLHLRIEASFERRAITNVIGVLRGSAEPEKIVLLGNHHDAWVYGAVDPASGTAAMLELARVAGELKRRGFPPRRTLVFGNWDAEEWTLTGSTEWGEEREDDLARNGVACLNIDSAAAGPNFQATAVPTMRRLISEALRDVRDPRSGEDLFAVTLRDDEEGAFTPIYNAPAVEHRAHRINYDILGSGSDYTVFFNHIGMPSLDAGFDGPYGVYHSVLDNYFWMSRFGDPGFLYHTTMVRVWALLAYRTANADILPFEESPYPADVGTYLDDLEKSAGAARLPDLADLRAAIAEWEKAAAEFDARVAAILEAEAPGPPRQRGAASRGPRPSPKALAGVNASLMRAERDLLSAAGIPKRPWFRHLIYAPLPTYQAETLPGLREAIGDGDAPRAAAQARTLAAAVRARTATVRKGAEALWR